MIKITLDEFPLVLPRLLLAGGEVVAAGDEFGEHDVRRRGAVELTVQFAPALDDRQPHLPGAVGKHHHVRAKLGGGHDKSSLEATA